jgi:alcohol dehydrogenase (cytochrome c)
MAAFRRRLRRLSFVGALVAVGAATVAINQATGQSTAQRRAFAIPAIPAFTQAQLSAVPNGNWIDAGGNQSNDRYSALNEINTSNVASMHTVWHLHTGSTVGPGRSQSASAVVYNGAYYIVTGSDDVLAVAGATGQILWTYRANLVPGTYVSDGGGVTSRGLAMGDGMVFLARIDDLDVALNAQTGAVVWQNQIDSYTTGAFQTAAPTYVPSSANGPELIVSGAGGEIGVRGYVEALSATTGKEIWKTYMVPGPGDPGHATWGYDYDWAHGGASVWTHPVVDYSLGLVYVATGNASPYVNRAPGNDLYTASDVALDINTGKIVWYYQTVHHDQWDDDIATSPTLINYYHDGHLIKALQQATKMGYNFIVDRATGKPTIPIPEVPQTQNAADNASLGNSLTQPIPSGQSFAPQCATAADWIAHGGNPNLLGPDGNPISFGCVYTPLSSDHYTAPGYHDDADWPPTSYNPKTALIYVCSTEDRDRPYKAVTLAAANPVVGKSYTEVTSTSASDWVVGLDGVLTAIRPTNNMIAWQMTMPDGNGCYSGSSTSGTSAKTGLVFIGTADGHLLAVSAKTGQVLWTSPQLEAAALAPPTIYSVFGHEYVSIMVGGTSASSEASRGDDVYAFALSSVPQIGA